MGVDGGVYAGRTPNDRMVRGQRDRDSRTGMGDAGYGLRLVRPDGEHSFTGTTRLHPVRGSDDGRRVNNRGWFFGKDWFRFESVRGPRYEGGTRIVQSGRTIGTGNSGDMVSGSNPLPGTNRKVF